MLRTSVLYLKLYEASVFLAVQTDVTALRKTVKDSGLKFFPAYLWLVTKNLNRQTEFKLAEKDGTLGFYDTLTPLYAGFHNETHTFSLMWTEYTDRFVDFYRAYCRNQENFGHVQGVLSQPQTPPPNAYTVSCVPWIDFTHFAVHSYENKPYYFPSVEAGKFVSDAGRTQMTLSLTCHHAAAGGWHVKCFLESLQEDFDHFTRYL